MNLPRFSIQKPTLIWILLLFMTAWGTLSYLKISRREDPEIKISMALIITIWPGASTEKVEQLITKKIEDKVEEISTVKKIQSTSRENLSVIFVQVDFASDIDMAWQKLRNKIAEVRSDLPQNIMGPDIMDDFGDVTAMIWSLSSDTASPIRLKELADELKAEIRSVESVGKVALLGEQKEAIYIEGPLHSFTLYRFSPFMLAKILDYQNVNMPSGYVRSPTRNYRLEPTGSFQLLDQIRDSVLDVSQKTGAPLKVRDVFTVRQGYAEPPIDQMFTNGKLAVGLDVRMKGGYNIVAMGQEVKAKAAEFAKRLPPDVTLTLLHDQPREVDSFINEFMVNLVEGLAIVVVVLFLSMGIRTAAIIALSLPLSLLFTFALMPPMRVDLETVSIASFIIALGMLVDNAIIVIDNIYVYMARGMDRLTAAYKGAQDLLVPIITGTLGTVFAFLPLLIMKDEIGAYIRSLPLVVSISLLSSLLLAVTLVPLLAYLFLKPGKRAGQRRKSLIHRGYVSFMGAMIRVRYLLILASLASLVGAMALLPVVGFSFFPEADRDQMTVDIWLPEGSSLSQTRAVTAQVEAILAQEKDIVSFVSYVGKGGPRFHITVKPEFNTSNYAQVMANTRDPRITRDLVKRLNKKLKDAITGARVTAQNLLLGIPVEAPVAIQVTGPDIRIIKEIGLKIQEILRDVPGTEMVRDNMGEEVPSLKVNIDSEAAAMVGITNTEVALSLLTAYDGLPVTKLRIGEKEIPITLRLAEGSRDMDNTLQMLTVPSQATGAKVPLSAFATFEPQWGPGIIKRFNNRRSIMVLAGVQGRLADEVMREAWPRVQAIPLPPGYKMESAGEEAERNKAFGDLIVVFGLIIGALLLMLVIQFNSLKRALVILFSVPLAIIGAILGLYFSGNSFSFMAFLGVVSLAGMVIKNAVVWVEFVERALEEGQPLKESIIEAGRQRLRPIILTAATTIGGLIPLGLFGGVLWEGMAWAMIFGLTLATVLTLVVIPVIYYTILRRQYERPPKDAPPVAAAIMVALVLLGGEAQAGHPLSRYLEMAQRRAMEVQSAELDLWEARTQRQQALASFVPLLTLEASVTRLDQEQTLALDTSIIPLPMDIPPMVLVDQNVYRVSGKLTVPLLVGGKRFAYLAAANHGISARGHALRAVERGIRFGTSAMYIQLLEAHYRALVLEEALRLDRLLVTVAEQRLQAGMATPFDVSYARTMEADRERKLAMAQTEVRKQRYAFNDLVGRPLGSPVELRDMRFDQAFGPSARELMSSLSDRAEMRGLAEGVAASQEMVDGAWGDLLPTVALIGEGGYKAGDFGYTEGSGYWMVTAALQWNLMADALAWARLRGARIESQRAELKLVEMRRKMELELAQALQLFVDTRKILEVATRGVKTAWEGYRNAGEAYSTGVLAINPVVEASKALAEAKDGYVQAYYARLLAEVQLRYRGGQPVPGEANLQEVSPLEALGLDPAPDLLPAAIEEAP